MTPAIVVEATVGSRAASSDPDHPANLPKEVQELRHANAFNPSLYRLMSELNEQKNAASSVMFDVVYIPGGPNTGTGAGK